MIEAVILYGSKARNDHDRFSDTDLLGIASSGSIEKPFDDFGVSFHVYPEEWLVKEARSGAIFLLHIITEAIPIFDPYGKLSKLKKEFNYKDTYRKDGEIGCRIVAATLDLTEREFTPAMRRRYFWGLRTALMADAAERRSPTFSAKSLENSLDLAGLALHIQTRADASLAECQRFGRLVNERLNMFPMPKTPEQRQANLRYLFDFGGMGTSTAADIIYSFKPDASKR